MAFQRGERVIFTEPDYRGEYHGIVAGPGGRNGPHETGAWWWVDVDRPLPSGSRTAEAHECDLRRP